MVLWYGFHGRQFNYASHIWLGHALVAMATKICDFQHKVGYNSACAGDTRSCSTLSLAITVAISTTGKMRILLRINIRILPVATSAYPHIRFLPESSFLRLEVGPIIAARGSTVWGSALAPPASQAGRGIEA